MPYKIYPCPECKYYEQENNKRFCENIALWGYRKELTEVVRFCPRWKPNNNNNNK